MIAAAATRGDVVLKNVIPRHLEIISAKLIEAGVNISEGEDSVRVWVNDDTKFKHINFIAMPYPGFPTDMQPQLVTFLTTIEGTSMAREGVWDLSLIHICALTRDAEVPQVPLTYQAIPLFGDHFHKVREVPYLCQALCLSSFSNQTAQVDVYKRQV